MVAPIAPESKIANSSKGESTFVTTSLPTTSKDESRAVRNKYKELRKIWLNYLMAATILFLISLFLYLVVGICLDALSFKPARRCLRTKTKLGAMNSELHGDDLNMLEKQLYNENVPKLITGLAAYVRGPTDELTIMDYYSKPEYGISRKMIRELQLFILGNRSVTCQYMTADTEGECLQYMERDDRPVFEDDSCAAVDKRAEHVKRLRNIPMVIKTYMRAVLTKRDDSPAIRCILLRKVMKHLATYLELEIPEEIGKVSSTTTTSSPPAIQNTPEEISDEDRALASDHMLKWKSKYELLLKAGALRAVREELDNLAKKFSYYRRKYPDIIKDTQHFLADREKETSEKQDNLVPLGTLVERSYAEEEAKHLINKRSAPRKGATNNVKRRTSSTARPTTQSPTTLNIVASTAIPEPTVKDSPTKPFKEGGSSTPITTPKAKDDVSTIAAKTGAIITTPKPEKVLNGTKD